MKKFVLKTIVFFLLILILDIALGQVFTYLTVHSKGGYTYRDNYICDSLRTDILLSGSSRCVRHYNPAIFSNTLGVSCYNTGQMGNGIILNYGRLKMINERQHPKFVIYDVTPSFDMLIGDDDHRYLTWLKGHYDRDGISDIFNSVDKTEKYKMMSQLYRYNSRILELISDFFLPLSNANTDGFSPLKGKLDKMKVRKEATSENEYKYDPLKLEYIIKYIQETGPENLIFVVSPSWYGMDSILFQPLKKICYTKKIPFIDFSNHYKYVHNDSFFRDGNHLNAIGADEFTKDLVELIKTDSLIINKIQ